MGTDGAGAGGAGAGGVSNAGAASIEASPAAGAAEVRDPCDIDNGGCDPHVVCAAKTLTAVECGACPAGYLSDGAKHCVPTLLSLVPSEGSLSPEFDPAHAEYTLALPLLVDSLTFGVDVPAGAKVSSGSSELSASGYLTPIVLDVGTSSITLQVSEPGQPKRSYSVSVKRGVTVTQTAYVKASENVAHSDWGFDVALDGDTMAAGGGWSNAVDIYTRTSTGWAFQARVAAAHGESGDGFGYNLALSGDTLVVGAPFEDSADGVDQSDNSAANSGAVYVFTRKGVEWTERAFLKASSAGYLDTFGTRVALSPDPDLSGAYILAVGAPCESSEAAGVNGNERDDSARDAGAVYVFGGSGGSWAQRAYLKASNTVVTPQSGVGAQFGSALSLHGSKLAVGAPNEGGASTGVNQAQDSGGAPGSGAVYVFQRVTGHWQQQAYVKASNTHAWDNFGNSVALEGSRLAVGAYWEHSNTHGVGAAQQLAPGDYSSGAVYLFDFDDTQWAQTVFIKASNGDSGDGFGQAVALHEGVLAVTACREASGSTDPHDNSAAGAGAAYLYTLSKGTWVERAYVKASNPDGSQASSYGVGDGFGQAVRLDARTLLVGAPYESSTATLVNGNPNNNLSLSSGAVYIFE